MTARTSAYIHRELKKKKNIKNIIPCCCFYSLYTFVNNARKLLCNIFVFFFIRICALFALYSIKLMQTFIRPPVPLIPIPVFAFASLILIKYTFKKKLICVRH